MMVKDHNIVMVNYYIIIMVNDYTSMMVYYHIIMMVDDYASQRWTSVMENRSKHTLPIPETCFLRSCELRHPSSVSFITQEMENRSKHTLPIR